MALIHQATLTPTKNEILASWTPSQPWARGLDTSSLEVVGAYRFDDPEGEVGIETHLLRTGAGAVLQVPLTYRSAPLIGAEGALLGTMQHSVLGERWVYDGCADPVYFNALVSTMLTGGIQADLDIQTNAGVVRREPTTFVTGSGTSDTNIVPVAATNITHADTETRVTAGDFEIVVRRVVDGQPATGLETLVGTWPGQAEPMVLAALLSLPV